MNLGLLSTERFSNLLKMDKNMAFTLIGEGQFVVYDMNTERLLSRIDWIKCRRFKIASGRKFKD